jgi:hypothetical protein
MRIQAYQDFPFICKEKKGVRNQIGMEVFRVIIQENPERNQSDEKGGRFGPMNKAGIKGFLGLLLVVLATLLFTPTGECGPSSSSLFTDRELDDLLAPIALYPDPLLAEILPASTYPEEVAEAAAWLNSGGDLSRIDAENWDEAVKAVVRYPDILFMMSGNLDWTADVGDAFLDQPEDVTKSIQRLRWQARAVGNLVSNMEQTVVIEDDYIRIIPAQPQYIYVPRYNPAVVYVQRPAAGVAPFITFGFGLAIGAWLIMDFDWHHHHVIYHGWNRPGWVNKARPYVHVTNVYINRSRPYINQTWKHDPSRGNPDRYRASRPGGPYSGRHARPPDVRGRTTTPVRPPQGRMFDYKRDAQAFSNRGRESRAAIRPGMTPPTPAVRQTPAKPPSGASQKPTPPTPSSAQKQPAPTPGVSKAPTKPATGGSPKPAAPVAGTRQPPAKPAPAGGSVVRQPAPGRGTPPRAGAPSGAFGGYRGASEAKAQSLRGQASRQSSAAAPRPPAPARKGGGSAGKSSAPAGKAAPKDKPVPQK